MINNNYHTWVEINKSALIHNLKEIKSIIPQHTKICSIIKSNAYGHDMNLVAKSISRNTDWLGVVNSKEALTLLKNKLPNPILILSYLNYDDLEILIKSNVRLPIYSFKTASEISSISKKLKKTAFIHYKIDSGTGRIGLPPKEALRDIKKIQTLPNIKIEGIFTHLADSENKNEYYTKKQISIFQNFINSISKDNIFPNIIHSACSAASLGHTDSHNNLIRYGISLYGLWPSKESKERTTASHPNFTLKPALSWKTRIIQTKTLPKKSYIGYCCTYKTTRSTRVSVIPVGYFEGYSRLNSNTAKVIINDSICPVIGNICMNLTMIDTTKVPNLKPNNEVILIGSSKNHTISADKLATISKTINYEITTKINPDIPRILV